MKDDSQIEFEAKITDLFRREDTSIKESEFIVSLILSQKDFEKDFESIVFDRSLSITTVSMKNQKIGSITGKFLNELLEYKTNFLKNKALREFYEL